MQFDEVLKRRLRGMAVRILANIEHTLGADLADMDETDEFVLTGAELSIIRSEILNAAGDTTRSLASLVTPSKPGKGIKVSLERDVIAGLNKARVDILETPEDDDDIPTFKVFGDFNLLHKIRNEVGAGVVYNKSYTCAGMDDVIDSLMPFLDSAQIAGVKIAGGEYKEWRDAVCEMYLEDLGDE